MIWAERLHFLSDKIGNNVFKNSVWGVLSNITQNILFSIFFIVIARKYSTTDFASYIIANTLYGFVSAFSTLGLGWWFVREIIGCDNKKLLISQFFKMQMLIGLFFFCINIALGYVLYQDATIRALAILVGINIVFDNIIYVIKFVNIADQQQKKTFIIFTVEATLKFLVACVLFFSPLPIVVLAGILILLRFITLNLFIRFGSSKEVDFLEILKVKLAINDVKEILVPHFPFIVIGSVAVVFWRISGLLVSKLLALVDVANYEISFKLFSIAQILPVIVSTSLYPLLVKSFNENNLDHVRAIYKKAYIPYLMFGFLAYTIVYSFSETVIPFLFGHKYNNAAFYCKEMFLTILVFPTAFLQANVLTAMKKEKLDMWFNLASLVVNVLICVIGLYFFRSLSVVNYGIFTSFLIFHLLQDFTLVKLKVNTLRQTSFYYIAVIAVIAGYRLLDSLFDLYAMFLYFWFAVVAVLVIIHYKLSSVRIYYAVKKE